MELGRSADCIKVPFETVNDQSDFGAQNIEISPTESKSAFKCTICNFDLENATDFENHNKKVHCQNKIQCPICHTLFRRRDHMRRHLRTVHSAEKPTSCPICSQDCKEQNSLNQHMRDSHPHVNQYYCTECQFYAASLQTLECHKKIHMFTHKYVCEICNACFKRQDHLNRHTKSLHLNIFVTCEICKQIFKRRDHMQRHMREKHFIFKERRQNM